MYVRSYGIAMAMLLVFVGSPSYGQSPSCYDPMEVPGTCLPWGYLDLTSELGDAAAASRHLIVDLSRDGSTLAGFALSPLEAFRWRIGEGVRVFNGSGAGISNPKLFLNAPVMSETGAFIAADGVISGKSRVFRWDAEAGNTSVLVLPVGPAGEPSQPSVTDTPRINASMSGDGQTIVGQGEALFPSGVVFSPTYPFIWKSATGTDGSSQQAFTFTFRPLAVDGIGSRVVGHEFTNNIPSEARAVFWTASGGTVVGAFPESQFTASSYDGQILAGFRANSSPADLVGFRWTSAGGIEDITDFGFRPRAISDSGNVISGSTINSALPVVRTELFGPEQLQDYLFFSYGLDGLKDPVTNLNGHAIVSGDGNVFTVSGSQWVAKVSPLQAVAMGDSYSSGEGALLPNQEYLAGTDIGKNNRCHRSSEAYGVLMTPPTSFVSYQLLSTTFGTGFDWQFIACSGARTLNVLSIGEPRYPAEPPQLAQGLVNADTDLVTITIGGNDALFSRVLRYCATRVVPPSNCFEAIVPGGFQTWEQHIRERIEVHVKAAVTLALQEIVDLTEGNATVVLMGYPLLVSDAISCATSGLNNLGAPGLSRDERLIIRQLGRQLNQQLAEAARQAGVHYVPIFREFEGRNVCDSAPRIKGVVLAEGGWFHPDVDGQSIYAEEFDRFLFETAVVSNPRGFFESGMPRNPAPVP
jgi:hypothetical protein